jgi:hypothetical protein
VRTARRVIGPKTALGVILVAQSAVWTPASRALSPDSFGKVAGCILSTGRQEIICEVPSWTVEITFSGDCFQFSYTAYCGSILGPVFCAIPCWGEICFYENGGLSVHFDGTCLGPICL